MEKIIYNPSGLKLKYIPTGKIYSFDETCELVKYNSERFEVVKSQDRLF